ncbi:hypothetical protein LMG29542_07712 [Paraburkholderia humisilvae]|uniref:Uncharacterized protein n=3 Tax=Paraburkholderia humisilvae TaxID=627669 RepID=A0A6J5F642_9BURK|nr:hypothetical protein LMG29542_07712 [Paraburkholderia humisilvae]
MVMTPADIARRGAAPQAVGIGLPVRGTGARAAARAALEKASAARAVPDTVQQAVHTAVGAIHREVAADDPGAAGEIGLRKARAALDTALEKGATPKEALYAALAEHISLSEIMEAASERPIIPKAVLDAARAAGKSPLELLQQAPQQRVHPRDVRAVAQEMVGAAFEAMTAAVRAGAGPDDALFIAQAVGANPRPLLRALRAAGAGLGAALEAEADRAAGVDLQAAQRQDAHKAEAEADPAAVLRAALANGTEPVTVLAVALDAVRAVRDPVDIKVGQKTLRVGGDPRPTALVALDVLSRPDVRLPEEGRDTRERLLARLDSAEAEFQKDLARLEPELNVLLQKLGKAGNGEQKALATEYMESLRNADSIQAVRELEDRANDDALIHKRLTDGDYETVLKYLQIRSALAGC